MSKNKRIKSPQATAGMDVKTSQNTEAVNTKKTSTTQKGLWMQKYVVWLIPLLCVCFIAGMSYVSLYAKNSDVFFMVQLHSLFNDTGEFFRDCMKTPGGLLQWMALWCTQLFYHPGQGIALLTVLWILAFFLIQKAFRIPVIATSLILIPISALMVSEIDLGYWIYIIKMPGYYFRETLGVICVALLVWLSRADKWSVAGAAVAALTYPLTGWYSPLALLCILVFNVVSKRVIGAAVALVLGLVSPLLWRSLYTTMQSDELYTVGFPMFQEGDFTDWTPSMPFFFVIASLVVLAAIGGATLNKGLIKRPLLTGGVLCAVVLVTCGFATDKYQYDDENFRAECRVYADAEDQKWDDLLSTVAGVKGKVTRELIIMKNIALFETGDAGNSMYHYDDYGVTPNVPDSLKMPMSDICSPLVLLYHGKTYFAYRWAMENAVEYGYNITELKIMAIASLINGEPKLASKYLNILSRTMYYKEWADRYRPCLKNPKLIFKFPETKHICMLYNYMGDMIDNDMGLTEKYLMSYYARSICVDNMYVQEMCMAYAMITKDIATFWRQFNVYAHFHNDIPIHYQEAAFLYGNLEPQSMDISHMPFDKEKIVDRYASFNARTQQLARSGMSEEAIGDATFSEFGDTFWWTYYFNRGSHYY